MKRSSLIGHLVELLDLFRGDRQPADRILKAYYRRRGYLGSKDRRYISECFFGLLRNLALVEYYAGRSLEPSPRGATRTRPPSIALLTAYLVRVGHDDAAALRPDVAGMWNKTVREVELDTFFSALLTIAPPGDHEGVPAGRLAIEYSLPEFIVTEWVAEFGGPGAEELCRSLSEPAPTSIRVNTLRCSVGECRERLAREGIGVGPARISPGALCLTKRTNVSALQSFREGWFEMQDEGSQIIGMLVLPAPGSRIVDACAGGGGKTLHLAALMRNTGTIVSIDVDEKRLGAIQPRLARAGVTIVELMHAVRDEARIAAMNNSADAVLVDAPCSGVGTFRRNPGAKMLVTPEGVEHLVSTQSTLLDRYANLVKPGGRLVYSTCTLLRAENQDQIEAFLGRHAEFTIQQAGALLRQQGIAIEGEGPFLVLLPQRYGTDGFFAAVLEKRV